MVVMVMITHYWRLHVPTGNLDKKEWDKAALTHAGFDPDKYKGTGISVSAAHALVNKWNTGTHHDYRYWID
jgi:hypothetical protein